MSLPGFIVRKRRFAERCIAPERATVKVISSPSVLVDMRCIPNTNSQTLYRVDVDKSIQEHMHGQTQAGLLYAGAMKNESNKFSQ